MSAWKLQFDKIAWTLVSRSWQIVRPSQEMQRVSTAPPRGIHTVAKVQAKHTVKQLQAKDTVQQFQAKDTVQH